MIARACMKKGLLYGFAHVYLDQEPDVELYRKIRKHLEKLEDMVVEHIGTKPFKVLFEP